MPRYIDADALMKEFRDFVRRSNNSDFAPAPTWNDAVSLVGSAPTADVVEREKGKWIKTDTHNYLFFKNDRVYKCEICGNLLDFEGVNGGRGDANYCPNCGAEMEADQ